MRDVLIMVYRGRDVVCIWWCNPWCTFFSLSRSGPLHRRAYSTIHCALRGLLEALSLPLMNAWSWQHPNTSVLSLAPRLLVLLCRVSCDLSLFPGLFLRSPYSGMSAPNPPGDDGPGQLQRQLQSQLQQPRKFRGTNLNKKVVVETTQSIDGVRVRSSIQVDVRVRSGSKGSSEAGPAKTRSFRGAGASSSSGGPSVGEKRPASDVGDGDTAPHGGAAGAGGDDEEPPPNPLHVYIAQLDILPGGM